MTERAVRKDLHAIHVFLTFAQHSDRHEHHRALRDSSRLALLNLTRSVTSFQKRLSTSKRLLIALSTADVPRLDQHNVLISTALRRGCGVNYIIDKLGKAAAGLYHVKGWKTDKDAADLAQLVSDIGGPLLLTALHKAGHLPCVNWVKSHQKSPRLMPFHGEWQAE